MLDSVLAVLLAPTLPTPGELKARKLALYSLTRMQIPAMLVRNKRNELMGIIRSTIARETPLSRNEDSVADALKVYGLLRLYRP